MKKLAIFFIVISVCGCGAKKPAGRYKIAQDLGPHHRERIPNCDKIPNAKPKSEPKSRIGNPKSYTVFNKKYNVLASNKNFKEKGKASWYGKKFHGYKTSNGEVYDMYGMTAAHKTLPLPTYLKVTNSKNGKSIVVRVNDRGPFHGNRIIDLSYAAAAKLDMLGDGTGDVEIRAIDAPLEIPKRYLQVGAFAEPGNARMLAKKLLKHTKGHEVLILKEKFYHVHIGPIHNEALIDEIKDSLIKNDFPEPLVLYK